MSRLTIKKLALAKIEATYGVDSNPTGSADTMVVIDPTFEPIYDSAERKVAHHYLGAQQSLHSPDRFAKLSFDAELAPSGVPGTPPPWGIFLRGCGIAETVTAGTRVEYNPISDGHESITIYFFLDRVLRKMVGCRGNFDPTWMDAEIPIGKFSFTGIDAGIVEAGMPTPNFSSWATPQLVSLSNTPGLKFGSTYGAGALSGGSINPSRGLSVSMGNEVKNRRMISQHSVAIVNRKTTGSVQVELTAAEEIELITSINANTLTSMSFEHGMGAGNKMAIFFPSVQRAAPKIVDQDGVAQMSVDLTKLPIAGNDDFRLILS